VPLLLRDTLLANGVDKAAIQVIPSEIEAINSALTMASKDDLLLVFCDQIARSWKQITGFNGGGPAQIGSGDALAQIEPAEGTEFTLEGQMLVRDDRGVRLARELED